MTGFLGTLFWALLALVQFIVGLMVRAFMCVLWLFWPVVVMGFLMASAQSAEAGWFSWFWGSNTRQLERSLDVAQEAARVASQAAEAQAQQAAAQAEQNARLAETLGQLSSERSNLADHLHALMEFGLKDSQWAAAINASGPMLICITVLIVAGLALWLANRTGDGQQHAELAETVDLLVEEIAGYGPEPTGIYGSFGDLQRLGHRHTPALVGYGADDAAEDTANDREDDPLPF